MPIMRMLVTWQQVIFKKIKFVSRNDRRRNSLNKNDKVFIGSLQHEANKMLTRTAFVEQGYICQIIFFLFTLTLACLWNLKVDIKPKINLNICTMGVLTSNKLDDEMHLACSNFAYSFMKLIYAYGWSFQFWV